jgi:RimJ/RimL family protein N-acetyltransferase
MTSVLSPPTPSFSLRSAQSSDLPQIVALGQRFLQSTPYARILSENPAQMQLCAEWLMTSEDGLLLIAEREDQVVGVIGVTIFPHPLSGERIAGELFWWVDPEARGTVGLRLLRRAETWAHLCGAVKMQMIAPNQHVERMYERLGYGFIESTYQKGLK